MERDSRKDKFSPGLRFKKLNTTENDYKVSPTSFNNLADKALVDHQQSQERNDLPIFNDSVNDD